MPGEADESFDFFLSRRGSVAAVAQEVENVLTEKGYKVFVQDYDIPLGASFIEAMHEAIKNSRDLIILFTGDYEASPYTRKEFTSFEAERHRDERDRHIVVLRCEDAPLRGLLADTVYQDLVGVADPEERRRRILAAAERQFVGAAAATAKGQDFCRRPAAHCGFYRPCGGTRPARRNSHPGQARRRDAGRPGGGAGHGRGRKDHRSPSNTPTASATSMTACGGVRRKRALAS